METNREVKIAIIVGLIMLTACIVVFIIKKNASNPTLDLNLHVLKHIKLADGTGQYFECTIETDKLAKINSEFTRMMNLKDKNKILDYESYINGDYKIVSGPNFVAFDYNTTNSSGIIYRSDTTAMYSYSSSIYGEIADYCSYITPESAQQAIDKEKAAAEEAEEPTEEKSKETNKDTKKAKKSSSSSKKSSKK